MEWNNSEIRQRLSKSGLKITSKRVAIIEAVHKLNNHPTAEEIIKEIRKNNPDIAVATVYKALNILTARNVLRKVISESDIARYDAVQKPHFHLYNDLTKTLEDYFDEELEGLIKAHFDKKGIPGFTIESIDLHIIGKNSD